MADKLVNNEQIQKKSERPEDEDVNVQYEFQVHNFENNDMETFKLIIDDKTITDYQDVVFAEQDKPKEAA